MRQFVPCGADHRDDAFRPRAEHTQRDAVLPGVRAEHGVRVVVRGVQQAPQLALVDRGSGARARTASPGAGAAAGTAGAADPFARPFARPGSGPDSGADPGVESTGPTR
ncbi:hypothetical protein ACU686_39780 [Yinghuangia aomiensis]